MNATNEELKDMYLNDSTEELEARLASCKATIEKYLGYGASWALDCRTMRIAESNSSYLWAELRRRETDTSELQCSQGGDVVEADPTS